MTNDILLLKQGNEYTMKLVPQLFQSVRYDTLQTFRPNQHQYDSVLRLWILNTVQIIPS